MKLHDLTDINKKELASREIESKIILQSKALFVRKNPDTNRLEEINFIIDMTGISNIFTRSELQIINDNISELEKIYDPKQLGQSKFMLSIDLTDIDIYDYQDNFSIKDNVHVYVVTEVITETNNEIKFKILYGFNNKDENYAVSLLFLKCIFKYTLVDAINLKDDSYHYSSIEVLYMSTIIEAILNNIFNEVEESDFEDLIISDLYWLPIYAKYYLINRITLLQEHSIIRTRKTSYNQTICSIILLGEPS